MIQALVLFVLGVGAAFLAYFAWHNVAIGSAPIVAAAPASPGIAGQA
jgi:hypothetical protein